MSVELDGRLQTLKELLQSGRASTQDELKEAMRERGIIVNQSTISRDLRRLAATKVSDGSGRVVYRLPVDRPPGIVKRLGDLVKSIRHNGQMLVIVTDPGSASLVARHIDGLQMESVLGTLAGDDTIFIAPSNFQQIEDMVHQIEDSLQS